MSEVVTVEELVLKVQEGIDRMDGLSDEISEKYEQSISSAGDHTFTFDVDAELTEDTSTKKRTIAACFDENIPFGSSLLIRLKEDQVH